MLATSSIEQIDRQLSELEELAKGSLPTARFFSQLAERLRLVLGAQGCLVFLATPPQTAMPLAQTGSVATDVIPSFFQQWQIASAQAASLQATARSLSGSAAQQFWVAVALRHTNYQKGCLLVTFPQKPSAETAETIAEIMAAFAEVAAIKQLGDFERFLDERWQALQSVGTQIAKCPRQHDAAVTLVNHLLPILGAARITLASAHWLGATQVLAISGIPTVDHRSPVTQALQNTATEVFRNGQPVLRQQKSESPSTAAADGENSTQTISAQPLTTQQIDENGLFSNLISLPLAEQAGAPAADRSFLVIEWQSQPAMLAAMPLVSLVLPIVGNAWLQHARWLRIPGLLRSLFATELRLGRTAGRLLKWSMAIAIVYLAYRVLTMNYDLSIEAPATVEPVAKRAIFAASDGFVEEILVDDGATVQAGQVVARLRSPSIDLQIEELRGQQRTLAERRSSLRVATGQIDPSSRDALVAQSRLSAEIAQLSTQESNLEQQLKLLADQRSKLELVSPMAGTIIARDLKLQLAGRPVRRGDALMSVADLSGPWQLRIEVADRDSGYVQASLQDPKAAEHLSTGPDGNVEFVLDALPEERFHAHVNWVSSVVQNRHGEGCYVEIHAGIDRHVVEQSQMGAGARVWFPCGQQPMWFVWCRPLVEAAQRKLWFWSEEVNEVSNQQ